MAERYERSAHPDGVTRIIWDEQAVGRAWWRPAAALLGASVGLWVLLAAVGWLNWLTAMGSLGGLALLVLIWL